MLSEMHWRARYPDGPVPQTHYAELDRSRLSGFDVYETDLDLVPTLSVSVPIGCRLVQRTRRSLPNGDAILMVAVESEDRSEVDLHLMKQGADGLERAHLNAYTPEVWAPELYDFETVRTA